MSSFYEDASLVMIPSGYKTSKVYSAKPTDGAGDLTFTRSNDTATRVNSAGLIEKVRTNLILQSNSFSDAAWVKLGAGTGTAPVLTANYTTDPFGGNNAWRFQCDLNGGTASGDRSWIYQTFAGSPSNGTLSIYVKLNSAGSVNLVFSDGAGDTQTVTSTTWVRLNIPSAAIGEFRLGLIGYNGTDTCDLSIAFSQVEAGDIATDYIATTSAAVSVGPVANVPRLDYLGSTCPRLLLEPQRTNSLTYSEQFDNAAWTKGGDTILTANYGTSPDGYQNADRLVADTSSGGHIVYRTITTTGTHTISIFAKASGYNYTFLGYDGGNLTYGIVFNLSNGTISQNPAGLTGTIEAVGSDGWYRCTLTYNYAIAAYFVVAPHDNSGAYNWTGNGTDGILIWGAQAEFNSAYASSYVNTLGAAVTRGEDDCVKSSATSIIGQTEGVVFFEWEYQNVGSSGGNIVISLDGAGGDEIYFWVQPNGTYNFDVGDSGSGVVGISGSMGSFGTKKIAFAYKNNDFALYINGVLAGTDTSGTVPTCNRLYVGRYWANTSYNIASGIKQVLVFKTRLSNADLAALTA
jgi:hypothetical protein